MKCIHTFVVLAYKESQYLEMCVNSVLKQKYPSEVIIATSTNNSYIQEIAKKYDLDIFENEGSLGIGDDFDFAFQCAKTELVTIAHQDDVYEYDYSDKVVDTYLHHKDALLIFSDYYEIKNDVIVKSNTNLMIKRILLSPLRIRSLCHLKISKRSCLALGNSICCPAVTLVKENLSESVYFSSDMKSNVDWLAWTRISKELGSFTYIRKLLMGHRVHDESATSQVINNDVRSKEDLFMFSLFWPKPIAKILCKIFKYSEVSNKK